MDAVKLKHWKQRFEQEIEQLQIEYDSFLFKENLKEFYSFDLDESDEWALKMNPGLPSGIKQRLEKLFLVTKPEDSV